MSIFLAIAVFPVGLAFIYFLSRSVLVGWISLLTVFLYDFTFGADVFNAGGLNLTIVEIVEICLLFAGIIRTIQRIRERNIGRRIALFYVAIFALSLVRGTMIHGFARTARLSSLFVAFLIACLYFLTAPYDSASIRKYLRIYLCYGIALTFVAILAYSGFKVGTVAWAHNDPLIVGQAQGRSLPSACALTICFCFFLSLAESRYRNSSVLFKWLPAVFLGMAIFLRHRSVWAVLAIGIASFFLVDKSLFRRLIPIAVLAVFFAASYALISGSGIQSTVTQISSDSTDDATWLGRLAMWQGLLSDRQTPFGVLLGKDLGGGYMQYSVFDRDYVDIPPHNEYLTQFLSVGIAGVVLILAFIIYPLKRFWKLSSTDMQELEPSASAWVAIIIGIVVYSIPYQPETDAYALLAMANAMVFGLNMEKESPVITA